MASLLKIAEQDGGGASSCSAHVGINLLAPGEGARPKEFRGRAAVITLGCAKNQVDSEVMIGVLRNNGFDITSELERADVAVVNTCGFLQSAVKESVDAILEVAEYKQRGRLRRLIVAGCLVERYRDELKKSLPEVNDFILLDDLLSVAAVADGEENSPLQRAARPYFLYDDSMPRQISNAKHYAYVKISEGCNRPCTFCIIPKIRGAMRSRTIESIVREVGMLGEQGVREVNLVAQDLTAYGADLKGGAEKRSLVELLSALDAAGAVPWIRLLYAYPIGIDERLLDTIAGGKHLCKYLDLPLQHSSEPLLREMKRPLGRYSPRNIIEFIRKQAPSIHLRTTFIVGFPGETERDIDDLEGFIREGHFANLGIFTYSPEDGSPAALMEGQISEKDKRARRERLMLAQQEVLEARLDAMKGSEVSVLIEGTHADTDMLLSARAEFQAPEVDASVIINDVEGGRELDETLTGRFATVRITDRAGYDLVGTLCALT